MKLNQKGVELIKKWDRVYCAENDKLGGNSSIGEFVEGWTIIDDYEHIKTINDECGLLLYGYESDALAFVEEWQERDRANDCTIYDKRLKFTYGELKTEIKKYLEDGKQ